MNKYNPIALCAEYIVTYLKENYRLKGEKHTYGDLENGGNIQIVVKSSKGDIEVGTVRIEYFALGGLFPAFFGDALKNNQSFRIAVDVMKQSAERVSKDMSK